MKLSLFLILIYICPAFGDSLSHIDHDPASLVIFWVTLIFGFSLLGRYIAKRLDQPEVLGELLIGVVIGNLFYFLGVHLFTILREAGALSAIMHDVLAGFSLPDAVGKAINNPKCAVKMLHVLQSSSGLDLVKVGYVLDTFSRYGVIFLLFMVGLESSFSELVRTGKEATRVAFIGVFAPSILGFAVAFWLIPNISFNTALFVGATLSATSIGITARVLSELKKLNTREARTILGAAMLDDILGLILLAIVSSLVIKGELAPWAIVKILFSALLFFAGSLAIGPYVFRRIISLFNLFELWEAKLFASFLFLMIFSWAATLVNLSSIIGAFAAGLIIHEGFFANDQKKHINIKALVLPFEAILAPLFFVLIGIQVKLESFLNWYVILIACGLILAAVIGKLVSGWGANRLDDRLTVGIGMLPRGEVGLIFASIGRTLGVINDDIFSAIVCMIMVTTFIAPAWLKLRYKGKINEV